MLLQDIFRDSGKWTLPYDVGAGLVLLGEAGCSVTDFSNSPYDPFSSRGLVTGFPVLKDELTERYCPAL